MSESCERHLRCARGLTTLTAAVRLERYSSLTKFTRCAARRTHGGELVIYCARLATPKRRVAVAGHSQLHTPPARVAAPYGDARCLPFAKSNAAPSPRCCHALIAHRLAAARPTHALQRARASAATSHILVTTHVNKKKTLLIPLRTTRCPFPLPPSTPPTRTKRMPTCPLMHRCIQLVPFLYPRFLPFSPEPPPHPFPAHLPSNFSP